MKKILEILSKDWVGPMLTPLEFVGAWTARMVSAPFRFGAKLMDKL